VGEIELYLDASFIVALLTSEPASHRVDRFIQSNPGVLLTSNFAAAEFASAISRLVRMREIPIEEGRIILSAFDRWAQTAAIEIEISAADIALSTSFLRRLDLPLRTPDAIHIAAALRLEAGLATLDRRTAANARALGLEVADI